MRMLVAFDIATNGRRRRVTRVLREFGVRVQKSAFEVEVEAADLAEMERRLRPLVDARQDRLAVYPIDRSGQRRVLWMGAGPLGSLPERKPDYFLV